MKTSNQAFDEKKFPRNDYHEGFIGAMKRFKIIEDIQVLYSKSRAIIKL